MKKEITINYLKGKTYSVSGDVIRGFHFFLNFLQLQGFRTLLKDKISLEKYISYASHAEENYNILLTPILNQSENDVSIKILNPKKRIAKEVMKYVEACFKMISLIST